MPFKVPKDISSKMQEKFPNVDVNSFIHELFNLILHKTLDDAACHVREFGKFVAFKKFSKKLSKNVVRFKFYPAGSLITKIRDDSYLLQNLPVEVKHEFNENHEKTCLENRTTTRDDTLAAVKNATQYSKEQTKKKTQSGKNS